jgi:hypothetical protein
MARADRLPPQHLIINLTPFIPLSILGEGEYYFKKRG